MKNIVFFPALILLLFFVVPACGQGDSVVEVTGSGNTYAAGGNVFLSDDVVGDLVMAGGQLTVNGDVRDDLTAAGGSIIVNGDVGGDVRVFGGQLTVNGVVGGELLALGGEITLTQESSVAGDAIIRGGSVNLGGKIDGNAKVSAETVNTGENAEILGNLELEAQQAGQIGSKVRGKLTEVKQRTSERPQKGSSWSGFSWILGLIRKILAPLLVGGIIIYMFPGFVSGAAKIVGTSYVKSFITGLVMIILVPFIGLIFAITIVGFRLTALLYLTAVIKILVATLPVKLVVGEWAYIKLAKKKSKTIVYYATGVLVFTILYAIPVFGFLVKLAAGFVGFGAIWILAIRASGLKKTIKI